MSHALKLCRTEHKLLWPLFFDVDLASRLSTCGSIQHPYVFDAASFSNISRNSTEKVADFYSVDGLKMY